NVCCCRPLNNRTPTQEEVATALPRLWRELDEFNPSRVLTVGNTPTGALLRMQKCKVTTVRGLWHFKDSQGEDLPWPLLPAVHPAAMLYDPTPYIDFCRDLEEFGKPEVRVWQPPTYVVCETYEH